MVPYGKIFPEEVFPARSVADAIVRVMSRQPECITEAHPMLGGGTFGDGASSRLPEWAHRIRDWRARHRWTQDQLARRLRKLDPCCQCDNGTVSRWERGQHRPSPLHEQLLCEVFEQLILANADDTLDEPRTYVRHVLGLDNEQA